MSELRIIKLRDSIKNFCAQALSKISVLDKKWVRIDLMMGFWQRSNTPHLPISSSPPLPHSPTLLLSIYNFNTNHINKLISITIWLIWI